VTTVLVTGANRGLGLEMVKRYAARGWRVHACARDTAGLAGLATGVVAHRLEVTDQAAVKALAATLAGEAIDLLINNAGVSGHEAGTLGTLDAAVWKRTFEINALAPLLVAEAFVEHVARSSQRKLMAISSRLGSIEQNSEGGRYAYRASKTALNMAWRSLAADLRGRGIVCTVLHPGWVRTDMGGKQAPLSIEESVAGLLATIDALGPADSGGFRNYDGKPLPW